MRLPFSPFVLWEVRYYPEDVAYVFSNDTPPEKFMEWYRSLSDHSHEFDAYLVIDALGCNDRNYDAEYACGFIVGGTYISRWDRLKLSASITWDACRRRVGMLE